MAIDNDSVQPSVDEQLRSLQTPHDITPDLAVARARLRERASLHARRTRRTLRVTAVAVVLAAGVVAIPSTRAAAQRLWDRLTIGRIEVFEITGRPLPTDVAGMFTMEFRGEPALTPASDAADAARIAGFVPALPPAGYLAGTPEFAVIKSDLQTSLPLKRAEVLAALTRAGITDVTVPDEWEGTVLTAEGGPVIMARYPEAGIEIMQLPPIRMNVPPDFPYERFMEIGFRLFGRNPKDAQTLAREIAANPAIFFHFPEREGVREVALHTGRGIIVGGDEDGICFFFNTPDRIFIVAASHLSDEAAVTLANSMQ